MVGKGQGMARINTHGSFMPHCIFRNVHFKFYWKGGVNMMETFGLALLLSSIFEAILIKGKIGHFMDTQLPYFRFAYIRSYFFCFF